MIRLLEEQGKVGETATGACMLTILLQEQHDGAPAGGFSKYGG
jgi:hypothetical protein